VPQKMLYLAHAHADSGDVFGYKAEGLSKSMVAGLQAKGIKDPQADVALMDAAIPIRPAEGGRPLCIYMRKQAREKFEVKADSLNHELKIGRSAMGSTGGDDKGRKYLFAIASAGDRVCAAPADITEGDALIKFINEDLNLDLGDAKPYLNHSSFFKGKPVTAAGEMLAKDGQLVDVNNATGHYKCKPKDLLAGARVLNGKGALNEETTVTVLLKGLPLPAGRPAPNRPYPPAAPDVVLVFNAKEFAKKGFDAPAAVTENFESKDDYYKDYKPAASVKELQSRFKLSADLEPSTWVAATPTRGSTVAIGGHRAGGGSAKPSPAAAASPGK